MRIAILNWTSRPVGGVGSYLRIVIPALARRGHDIAFWHELGEPPDGDPFALPAGSPSWSVEQIGLERALAGLSAWRQMCSSRTGCSIRRSRRRTLQIAPAVFHAHAYYGTCISGAKMFKSPTNMPCSRTFGWPCLVNYYPRRCGGWSPITMVREFRRQSARLELLSRYKAIVTLSSHMQREYARHGLDATWVRGAVEPGVSSATDRRGSETTTTSGSSCSSVEWIASRVETTCSTALPRVASVLNRTLNVTFAGDGPARASWQAAAATTGGTRAETSHRVPGLARPRPRSMRSWRAADLLVVPSLWPEPFGLVGLEAARHRLPVAAFAVGGIPDWLRSGVNGYLAPGDPPTPGGLADAIIACLKDPETHARLRDGAGRVAAEFSLDRHMDALMRVLHDAARSRVDVSTMVRVDGRP